MIRVRTISVTTLVFLAGACSSSGDSGNSNGSGFGGGHYTPPGSGANGASTTGATSTGASANSGGNTTNNTGGAAPDGPCEVGAYCSGASPLCFNATGSCQCVQNSWGLCTDNSRGGSGNVNTGGTTSVNTGGGTTVKTGGSGPCVPKSCAADNCGIMFDGCSQNIDCGACDGECGAITPNVCTPRCIPESCASLGVGCGPVSDHCGGLLQCGDCTAPQTCGGNAVAFQCGAPGGAGTCENFCKQQVDCGPGATTTITGTVLAPNSSLPLPRAIVYVPNASMTAPYGVEVFNDGVANGDACACNVTGNPLVQTVSGTDGSFTLENVPVGTNIPIVIQLGRWRRLITVPAVASCANTPLNAGITRLPTRHRENSPVDSVPLMALSTGRVDGLECVLRKMGLEDSQFTNPGGGGRVHVYLDNGSVLNNSTPGYAQLTANQATIDQYDALIFPCRGQAHDIDDARKARVLDVPTNTSSYVNKGGRAFFTHYSYAWLYRNAPSNQLPWLSTTNTQQADGYHWGDPPNGVNIQVRVNTAFERGQVFSEWLRMSGVDALSGDNPPQITVLEAREDMHTPVTLPITTAQEWLTTYQTSPNPSAALHVTFDMPWAYPPEQQCGRVLWSGFHVTTAAIGGGRSSTEGLTFPTECNDTFSAQEKVLAYMLFDMTSCISPPPPCQPKTCAEQGVTCGPTGDGCGGELDCGPCPPTVCVPRTCPADYTSCLPYADGCGGVLYCNGC